METGLEKSRIAVNISPHKPLEFRISYRDFALFTKLSSQFSEIFGSGTSPGQQQNAPVAPGDQQAQIALSAGVAGLTTLETVRLVSVRWQATDTV
jgi:hypothetical protein